MDELKQDVKDIKVLVIELVKQGAVHNQILGEHEKRSTSLETRLLPIEADYSFRHKLFSVVLAVAGFVSTVIAIVKSF